MNRRFLAAVLAGLMMVTGVPVHADDTEGDVPVTEEETVTDIETESAVTEGDFTYLVNANGNTVTLTGYMGTETDIVIPETFDGMNVTGITASAFSGKIDITSIVMPDTVTSLGAEAFRECIKLETIYLSKNLLTMGERIFENCDSLKDIILPEKLTAIPDYSFYECDALTEITIPSSVKSIGEFAFFSCSSLKNVMIEHNVESIGDRAFCVCGNLEKVTIPSTVISIDWNVFMSCTKLKTAGTIGGGYNIEFGWTETIPANAFFQTAIEKVIIPDGVTTIGEQAFYNCDNLSDITIPASVTKIENGAFAETSKLQAAGSLDSNCNVKFGWTKEIPNNAFKKMGALSLVYIPDTITSIGDSAFLGCINLPEVVLPHTLTSIGEQAFSSCYALSTVKIPANVTSIGELAFDQCGNLESAYFLGDIPQKWGDEVFCKNADDFAIHYPANNTSGWTTPTWKAPDGTKYTAYPFTIEDCEHSYTRSTIPPTCTAAGSFKYVCSECGDFYTEEDTDNPATGHDYIISREVSESCTSPAYIEYKCEICGDGYKEIDVETSALGHTYQVSEVVQATCTAQGYTVYTCIRCGSSHKDDYVSRFYHNYLKTDTVVEPTCDKEGYTVYKCSRCGLTTEDDETDALGHDWSEWTVVQEPTDTDTGIKERFCSTCGEKRQIVLHSLNSEHIYSVKIIDPTCTEQGYTIYTCSSCDYSYIGDYVDAVEHNYREYTREATCAREGKIYKECRDCEHEEIISVLPKTDEHEFIERIYTEEATCEKDGKTYRRCDNCDYEETISVLPRIEHDWREGEVTATCFRTGETYRYCRYCELEEILSTTPALGHNFVVISTVEASCDKAGYDNLECTRCMELTVGNIVTVPHTATKWIIDEPATETSDGMMHMDCAVCAYTIESRSVPCLIPSEKSGYTVDSALLKNVAPQTSPDDLTEVFAPELGEVRVYSADGTEITDAMYVGTGCEVRLVQDDVVFDCLTVIISGDFDGDGSIAPSDALYLLRHSILHERYPLYEENVDYNTDGIFDAKDAVYLLYHATKPEEYPLEN